MVNSNLIIFLRDDYIFRQAYYLLVAIMQTSVIVIIALLLVVVAGSRATYVQGRNISLKMGLDNPGFCSNIMDGCPMASYCPGAKSAVPPPTVVSAPVLAPATAAVAMSGFSGTDFLSHAREMDARKLRTGSPSSPARKMENLMMNNDHAQRKVRDIGFRHG